MTARILRRPKVEELTGLGRSAIYEYVARGQFPRPVRLSDKAVGWIEAEVSEWINARVAKRVARPPDDRNYNHRWPGYHRHSTAR